MDQEIGSTQEVGFATSKRQSRNEKQFSGVSPDTLMKSKTMALKVPKKNEEDNPRLDSSPAAISALYDPSNFHSQMQRGSESINKSNNYESPQMLHEKANSAHANRKLLAKKRPGHVFSNMDAS